MKKLMICFLLVGTLFSAKAIDGVKNNSISPNYLNKEAENNTKYFHQFSEGMIHFISTRDFSKIEKMFGDSGVYGSDQTPEEYNIYNIQLTSSELKDQLSKVLNDTTSNLIIVRNTNPYYTDSTFKHGTMFKFEVLYIETGRVDDFKVYVDYTGKLLTVSTHTSINIKGYIDGNIMEFVGNRYPVLDN